MEALVRGRNTAQKVVLRARIVRGCAEGRSNHCLAQELGITRPTVLLWRKRYAHTGVAGWLRDAPRPGRRWRIGAQKVEAIVKATLRIAPSYAYEADFLETLRSIRRLRYPFRTR